MRFSCEMAELVCKDAVPVLRALLAIGFAEQMLVWHLYVIGRGAIVGTLNADAVMLRQQFLQSLDAKVSLELAFGAEFKAFASQ